MNLQEYQKLRTTSRTGTLAWYCAKCDEIIPMPEGAKPTACPRCGKHEPVCLGYMRAGERRAHRHAEDDEQADLFRWAEQNTIVHPELELMYHIPNGGKRDTREAARLKRQGVKRGVPDIHLPVARGGFHSLYVELKVDGNTPTKDQKKWLAGLSRAGNATAVCYSAKQASEVITAYLKLTKGD